MKGSERRNEGVDTSIYPSSREVRDWAMAKVPGGISMRGALPRVVILAWNKAHPDRPYVASEASHGTPDGYQNHDCRCDRCLTVGRDLYSNRKHDFRGGAA